MTWWADALLTVVVLALLWRGVLWLIDHNLRSVEMPDGETETGRPPD